MNTLGYLIIALMVATVCYFGIRWVAKTYSRYRGTKIVICPETRRPTIVEVDALHASLTSIVGPPDIQLENCSRWPLKKDCGQECLIELDVAPAQCLVSGVLMRWYRGKTCVYCGQPFEELHWSDHKPSLQSPEGSLVEWKEVPIEKLPTVLDTHLAVCWSCYITQSFRRDHPDLVVYRPWRNDTRGDVDGSSASRHF